MSIKKRGFASMSEEKIKAIAGLGGKTAHKLVKAHQFTKEEARKAGKKGGKKRGINLKQSRSSHSGQDS